MNVISECKNRIIKFFSELNEYTKLAHKFKQEKEDDLKQILNEQSININKIMSRICLPDFQNNSPRLLTLNWGDPLWIPSENDPCHWQPQTTGLAPEVIRIGEIGLKYNSNLLRFPALVPIRDFSKELQGCKSGHIAFYSQDANSRQTTLLALQSVAFRMISTFPVRKFKGIFIDPVGMGDTFPFGNLHEFITSQRIYTRADDIREQLRGLTEHIEQVIQNYLGSNYSSIEDYNLEAGAISEPYRYLFIADFPTGFDQRALEDLKSILLNGPKTGVYVILHIDKNLEKPRNFDYQTFNDFCSIIDKFTNNSLYQIYFPNISQPFSLILDQPPPNELFNQMAEAINQAIRNVKVDTVAFSKLYPDVNWYADSRKEIRTPIGLMGAKDKLEFWFGENEDGGIVSNGLLAGKPGAGKSFTLHAIILSLAMQYSPDELELYLLDFKQGVEFQIYVDAEKGENRNSREELDETRALPHAKVISIESDREFGLSVLEYVNQQIEERSKLFKSAGNFEKNL